MNNTFRKLLALMLVLAMVAALCSCGKNDSDFDGTRFAKVRHITVMADTSITGSSNADINSSECARYIHDAVLRDCNIDVTFVAADSYDMVMGTAPDISFMSQYNSITTFYRMNAVTNIAPYIDQHSDSLSDLKELLGDENLYFCTDDKSEVWFISSCDCDPKARITFIRKDWLDKLGLDVPSTREEFQNCLAAFRDNADLLLGDEGDNMIPFFIDSDPSLSCKPLFDSMYDPEITDKDFYVNGYDRATQPGFDKGLQILNQWYLEGLINKDFDSVRSLTKDTYIPIENGYVGAFCAQYDFLYKNGEDSHINALHKNCGDGADYVAVNVFENSEGEYTYWHEDYLREDGMMIYLPETCSDPLACLVYLNWISDKENIKAVQELDVTDAYTCERYLLTLNGKYPDGKLSDIPVAEEARKVAMEVKFVQRGNKCVRYNESAFKYVNSEEDIVSLYPGSTSRFACSMIRSEEGNFAADYKDLSDAYIREGAFYIYYIRNTEWEKVMVNGDLTPW